MVFVLGVLLDGGEEVAKGHPSSERLTESECFEPREAKREACGDVVSSALQVGRTASVKQGRRHLREAGVDWTKATQESQNMLPLWSS